MCNCLDRRLQQHCRQLCLAVPDEWSHQFIRRSVSQRARLCLMYCVHPYLMHVALLLLRPDPVDLSLLTPGSPDFFFRCLDSSPVAYRHIDLWLVSDRVPPVHISSASAVASICLASASQTSQTWSARGYNGAERAPTACTSRRAQAQHHRARH